MKEFYCMASDEALKKLETSTDGLSSQKAQELIESMRNSINSTMEQNQSTGINGKVSSRTDYTVDLDIPPFLRRNKD